MYETTVNVEGMMCGMCEAHINQAVRDALPVKKVTSSHTKGITRIMSSDPLDQEALRQAIDATGYRVLSIEQQAQSTQKRRRLFGRR